MPIDVAYVDGILTTAIDLERSAVRLRSVVLRAKSILELEEADGCDLTLEQKQTLLVEYTTHKDAIQTSYEELP